MIDWNMRVKPLVEWMVMGARHSRFLYNVILDDANREVIIIIFIIIDTSSLLLLSLFFIHFFLIDERIYEKCNATRAVSFSFFIIHTFIHLYLLHVSIQEGKEVFNNFNNKKEMQEDGCQREWDKRNPELT